MTTTEPTAEAEALNSPTDECGLEGVRPRGEGVEREGRRVRWREDNEQEADDKRVERAQGLHRSALCGRCQALRINIRRQGGTSQRGTNAMCLRKWRQSANGPEMASAWLRSEESSRH